MLRLRALTQRFRESLFYVPALYVVGAVAVAWATTLADDRWVDTLQGTPLLLPASPTSARAVLATAAAATITVAGIGISITVVAVQLAASQFSPRVLRGFLRDRFSQNVIGLEAGVFTYCLLALATTTGPEASATARPNLSLTVAVTLAVVAVVAIVAFIDHSARSMQVGHLMRVIARETRDRVQALFPEGGGEGGQGRLGEVSLPEGPPLEVRAAADGWVQQIAEEGLLEPLPAGSTVRLETRVGGFVVEDGLLATVWPRPEDGEAVAGHLRRSFLLGAGRTMQQEVAFGLRQLTDIALRALSPGVNDPTTAYEALAHTEAILADLLRRDLPPRLRLDATGRRLLRPHDFDHADYVHRFFDQIRVAGASQPAVCTALLKTLARLRETLLHAGLPERTDALLEQARLVVEEAAARDRLPRDVERVRETARRLELLPADEGEAQGETRGRGEGQGEGEGAAAR